MKENIKMFFVGILIIITFIAFFIVFIVKIKNSADNIWRCGMELEKYFYKWKKKLYTLKIKILKNYYVYYQKEKACNLKELKQKRAILKAEIEALKVGAAVISVLIAFTTITFSFINTLGNMFNIPKILEQMALYVENYSSLMIIIGLLILLTISFSVKVYCYTLHLIVIEDLIEHKKSSYSIMNNNRSK